jgi:hypothetical protein
VAFEREAVVVQESHAHRRVHGGKNESLVATTINA